MFKWLSLFSLIALPAFANDEAIRLYAEHCASCHGGDRLGAIAPALLPENMGRLKKADAEKMIAEGKPNSQMSGFAAKVSPEGIKALTELIYTPLPEVPVWGEKEMLASHKIYVDLKSLPDKPLHNSDHMNLFTVVELGDHHITILDGDKFEPIARFPSRFALHGGAKYSPDGRFMHVVSRDGWVSRYDLYSMQLVAEIRAGVNSRNIAVSSDGKYVMVGNMLPHTLVGLDAETLKPVKIIKVGNDKGETSRISAVYNAPQRKSFIAALKDLPEIWEMSYDKDAPPVYKGFVHSRMKGEDEGLAESFPFPVFRYDRINEYLDDFFFTPDYVQIIGAGRDGGQAFVIDLDLKRRIKSIPMPGMPHLGSGITWVGEDGIPYLATPHLKEPVISVIDMRNWETVKKIPTLGPGFFMRSHENTPYAWADVFFGKDKDTIQIIDKRTQEIVKTLRPSPGKTAAHIEFTKDGRYALVSIWEMDGALVVYDAQTFEEVKRIPMKKPSGKYNIYNKITYSGGTSH